MGGGEDPEVVDGHGDGGERLAVHLEADILFLKHDSNIFRQSSSGGLPFRTCALRGGGGIVWEDQ